jgi:hypothetical protein
MPSRIFPHAHRAASARAAAGHVFSPGAFREEFRVSASVGEQHATSAMSPIKRQRPHMDILQKLKGPPLPSYGGPYGFADTGDTRVGELFGIPRPISSPGNSTSVCELSHSRRLNFTMVRERDTWPAVAGVHLIRLAGRLQPVLLPAAARNVEFCNKDNAFA